MSDTSLIIRDAHPSDRDTIVEYNRALAVETEGVVLELPRLRAGVEALFREPGHGRYFIAERDGCVVGQTLITYEWSDWRCGNIWWIQSVYVVAEQRGAGVFRALFEHIRELAQADPEVAGLRLYVDKDNRDALQVYQRLGLHRARYDMLELDFVLAD
ncbi:MAG: GNAT family N-acetyltransferase [Gammaproteobacteria bacterium]|nr:GNAT family N-acetyltransferase [Gammaproteobacteria bacterium]